MDPVWDPRIGTLANSSSMKIQEHFHALGGPGDRFTGPSSAVQVPSMGIDLFFSMGIHLGCP
eukprot:scaffold86_cov338-Pavlova_lutheri.AAC.57